uniref:Interleukin-1 beta n=1 Tax=Mola mola TaxID=94237 RepID=A0A3Q3XET4_MOLML
MDQESLVRGSVLIVHKIQEGRHQYEVDQVVKYKRNSGENAFASKGDKLLQINDTDLQDFSPEQLAQMLAEGNPKLTVHKSTREKEHTAQAFPAEDNLYPFSKESMLLSFSMMMRRNKDLEENGVEQEGAGREDTGMEKDVCKDENENGGEYVIVSMKKTKISMLRSRGCKEGSSCQGCRGTGCTLNDVVVMAESRNVMLVSRGSESFRLEKPLNVAIEHVASRQYLRGLCSQETLYASPNPEKMTVYLYKSNNTEGNFRGMPVVLNFSETNCFLRCCKKEEKVLLQVETCEKQRLQQISKSDDSALSFVFYMKADRLKHRKFESALHLGWFIQIVNTDSVKMATLDQQDHTFFFIFRSQSV